jgi:hypothetical protein
LVCLCIFFFTVTFKYPVSLQRHFTKYLALGIQLLGACVANSACLQESNAKSILCLVLYRLVQQSPTPPSCKLNCILSLKKRLLLNPNSANSNRNCFLSTECVYVGVTGQHSSELSGT